MYRRKIKFFIKYKKGTVAVVDVTNGGRSFVEGFIPTGWYPTSVRFNKLDNVCW